MTDSFKYLNKLRDETSGLDMEKYSLAFSEAVTEFCCFNRGKVVSVILALVTECDFDHEKAVEKLRASYYSGKFELTFGDEDDNR